MVCPGAFGRRSVVKFEADVWDSEAKFTKYL